LAKNYARKAGPEIHTETLISFIRNSDGTFTKIIKTPTRDLKTGIKRSGPIKPVETGPYVLTTNEEEADESQAYEEIDGSIQYMYFKLLQLDELIAEDEI
jgi:hypothetical protein